MINSKKKGSNGELAFSAWLRENGIRAWRDSASGAGSGDKGDVNNSLGYCIEIKTVKKINLGKAWKQVNHSASMNRNSPLLAIHLDGMKEKEWIVCLHSNDWLELVKRTPLDAPQQAQTNENSRVNSKARWKLETAKKAISETIGDGAGSITVSASNIGDIIRRVRKELE